MASSPRTLLQFTRFLQRDLPLLQWDVGPLNHMRAAVRLLHQFDNNYYGSVGVWDNVVARLIPDKLFNGQTAAFSHLYWIGSVASLLLVVYWTWKLKYRSEPDNPPVVNVPLTQAIHETLPPVGNLHLEVNPLGDEDHGRPLSRRDELVFEPNYETEIFDDNSYYGMENDEFQVPFPEDFFYTEQSGNSPVLDSVCVTCSYLQHELQEEVDAKLCVICQSEPRRFLIMSCGHLCLCEDCMRVLKQNRGCCPLCRKQIRKTVRVYW